MIEAILPGHRGGGKRVTTSDLRVSDEIGLPKETLDTPVLLLDLDAFGANVRRMAEVCRAAGVQWRPHTKGIKTPAIAKLLLQAGAIGVTCAKLGEAEVMAAAGIREILVANQVVGSARRSGSRTFNPRQASRWRSTASTTRARSTRQPLPRAWPSPS
jgi:Alanine racemase, N-terminal domain